MTKNSNFEMESHPIGNGSELTIPIYLANEVESTMLLKAAAIIGRSLSREDCLDLQALVDKVGQMLINERTKGLVIEDEDELSSLKITPLETIVHVTNSEDIHLDTQLLFDMLYVWLQFINSTDNS